MACEKAQPVVAISRISRISRICEGSSPSKLDGGNVAFEIPQGEAAPILIASNPGKISLSSSGARDGGLTGWYEMGDTGWLMSNRDGGNVAFEMPHGDVAAILIGSNPGTIGLLSSGV